LAARLAALLQSATGTRWTIALSALPGAPTIAEQGAAATTARLESVADHPLVRAIMAAFPGAKIETVHDATADLYGLPPDAASLIEPDVPAFAPPDAELADDVSPPWEIDA
jgi:DNA polymerase-3 subunit gamma/tau